MASVSSLASPNLGSVSFFIRGQSMKHLEEDRNNEFKAHRQLSDLEMSEADLAFGRFDKESMVKKVPIKRKSLSPYICGMLNTGEGGRMYLGVTDQGRVAGLMMSQYQKDHFELALADLLARYTPPVPSHAVRIAFVPVKESDEEQFKADPMGFRTKANRRHVLRNSKYCWCDLNSMAALEKGMMHNFYVIEIIVMPGGNAVPAGTGCDTPANIVYDNEEGKAFMRGFGSTRKLRGREIMRMKNGGRGSYTNELPHPVFYGRGNAVPAGAGYHAPANIVYDKEEGKAFIQGFGSTRMVRGREDMCMKNGSGGPYSNGLPQDPVANGHGLSQPPDEEEIGADEEYFSLSD